MENLEERKNEISRMVNKQLPVIRSRSDDTDEIGWYIMHRHCAKRSEKKFILMSRKNTELIDYVNTGVFEQ